MKAERIILTIAGATGIAGFFMSFFKIKKFILELSLSGYTYVKAGLDMAGIEKHPIAREFVLGIKNLIMNADQFDEKLKLIGLAFILLGPIFFVLHSIGHFVRGMMGKQYKRGIFFALAYMGGAWAFLKYYGNEVNMNINFFELTDIGFWISFTAIIVAAFSVFFEGSTGRSR